MRSRSARISPSRRSPPRTVERAERLVEHQQAGRDRERAGQRDPLLLAARELRDPPVAQLAEPDEIEHLGDARRALAAVHAGHAQPELDVARDVAVREQRVLLEHQPEPALVRRHRGEVVAVPA